MHDFLKKFSVLQHKVAGAVEFPVGPYFMEYRGEFFAPYLQHDFFLGKNVRFHKDLIKQINFQT